MRETSQPTEMLSAPPRVLLWLVLVMFFLLVVAALAGVSYFTGGQRLGSLIPFAGIGFVGVLIFAIGGAVVYRRSLPRLMWLWVSLVALALVIGAVIGGIVVYRNILPPRYQEEIVEVAPFLRALMPPTPQGGIVPTVAPREGGISPDDLLALPAETPTAAISIEATEEATESVTEEAAAAVVLAPSATPLPSVTPTTAPPTSAPTLARTLAPTSAPQDTTQNVSTNTRLPAARMYGFTHVRQDWNNCGPANITMALSFFGWRENQDFAANVLKPNDEDKNVSPVEMVNFVRDQTFVRAITRVGGDLELVKQFINANIPVIVETGYYLEGDSWLGHYQTVVGYDDMQGVFYVYDSWLGTGENEAGLTETYRDFDANWQAFNRTFIAIYEPDRESVVQNILGELADVQQAEQHALEVAIAEARADRQNPYAWFNMGSSYTKLGDYERAASAFDQARQLGTLPYRMLWYQFGPFEAYFETGRYDDVLALADTNITTSRSNVEEAFYWQGKVYAALGRRNEAQAAFQQALSKNSRFEAARDALNTL